jgi:hypothetical protein
VKLALRSAAAVCAVVLTVVWAAAAPAPDDATAAAVTWRELNFAARKLGISASIAVRLQPLAEPAGGAFVLESTTHLPGRTFVAREVLDRATAAAREVVDTETGAKQHRKTYTLGERGFQLDVLEPASVKEMLLPPERWMREERAFTAYPEGLPAGAVITGPAGLLVVAAAGDLHSPGDSVMVYVLVQDQVERVTTRVEGVVQTPLDFQEDADGSVTPVRGEGTVLKLVARGQPVGRELASVFRLFGLEGDVTILWDPVRRLPVELAGQVRMLGHVEVHLVSLTLR